MSTLIKDTTREERKKIIEDAIAISSVDSLPPTDMGMKLYHKYIEGEMELSDITQYLIAAYKQDNV